jgi:hypothetical protein
MSQQWGQNIYEFKYVKFPCPKDLTRKSGDAVFYQLTHFESDKFCSLNVAKAV